MIKFDILFYIYKFADHDTSINIISSNKKLAIYIRKYENNDHYLHFADLATKTQCEPIKLNEYKYSFNNLLKLISININ